MFVAEDSDRWPSCWHLFCRGGRKSARPRVNKQGPRRQFPPKVYLVKKLSPGTVSSANSGVAPVPLVNSLPAKNSVKQRSGAWLLVFIIILSRIRKGEQSSECTVNRRNYKLWHAVIECCFAVFMCEAHSFYPSIDSKHFSRSRIYLFASLCIITARWSHWKSVPWILTLICWVVITIMLPCRSNKLNEPWDRKIFIIACWVWIIWMNNWG
jgi:hypothetical protein